MRNLVLTIFILIVFSITYCSATNVSTEPVGDYWRVNYQGLEVKYHKDACGSLSKNVLLNVSHDSEAGEFDWSKMMRSKFRNKVLRVECKRLQEEMINRSLMDTILNRGVE